MEMVKITIRLPLALVKLAKVHAVGLGEDLQDLVARELWDALREKPIPLSNLHLAAAKEMELRKSSAALLKDRPPVDVNTPKVRRAAAVLRPGPKQKGRK